MSKQDTTQRIQQTINNLGLPNMAIIVLVSCDVANFAYWLLPSSFIIAVCQYDINYYDIEIARSHKLLVMNTNALFLLMEWIVT